MESSDLSSWLGRPPPVAMHDPSAHDSEMQEAELNAEIDGIVDEIAAHSEVVEEEDGTGVRQDSPVAAESSASESAHEPEEEPTRLVAVGVAIPHIKDTTGYEPLPGHSTVKRILLCLESPEGVRYKIKLYSGEIDTVSVLVRSLWLRDLAFSSLYSEIDHF